MADSSLIQVIVPALIGLGGTIIGSAIVLSSQWLLERKKQEAEKKRKKAEKLEELASALYAYEYWINDLVAKLAKNRNDIGKAYDNMKPCPFSKLQAISNVYFQEFRDEVQKIDDASEDYTASIAIPDNFKNKDTHNPYQNSVERLISAIEDYAKREFQ
jgi:hypothetical protein